MLSWIKSLTHKFFRKVLAKRYGVLERACADVVNKLCLFERLETRQLMSMSATQSGNKLTVDMSTETAGHEVHFAWNTTQFFVFVDGAQLGGTFTISSVTQFDFKCGSGADSINANLNNLVKNATVAGNNGNDTISGGKGADSLVGGNNDDIILGNAGNDTIIGGSGYDVLDFQDEDPAYNAGGYRTGAISVIIGGQPASGTERDSVTSDVEEVWGTSFADTMTVLSSLTGGYALLGNNGNDSITGAQGADYIDGGSANDCIVGGSGNDTIRGFGGTDNMDAGAGVDTVQYNYSGASAGVGVNLITGAVTGAETETASNFEAILGSSGNDTLTGNSAGNYIDGAGGNDLIKGNGGNDSLVGGAGNDSLYGEMAGAETISGSAGNDLLVGDDQAWAVNGTDCLVGGDGNDTLEGGQGLDTIDGGNGTDWTDYSLDAGRPSITVTIKDTSAAGSEDLLKSTVENIVGTVTGADSIQVDASVSSSLAFQIYGLGGNDTLVGGGGNDYIDGSTENDSLKGNGGNDTLVGAAGNDSLLGDDGNDFLVGDDQTWTVSGTDSLVGGNNDDTLEGGQGLDTIDGGSGTDTADYSLDAGRPSVSVTIKDSSAAGSEDLIKTTVEKVIGTSAGADLIKVDASVSATLSYQFFGLGGNDTLFGGGGNDYLDGSTGTDSIKGNGGNDTAVGGAGNDTLYGDMAGAETINGTAGNDVMVGQDGNDSLYGGVGNDTLCGGAGLDSLLGEAGNDFLVGDDAQILSGQVVTSGASADVFDGGADSDTVSYLPESSDQAGGWRATGVTIVIGGTGGEDNVPSNVEQVIGSSSNDTIRVDSSVSSTLNFQLDGRNGNDTITGGAGSDYLFGGNGNDSLIGSGGFDTVDYFDEGRAAGVNVIIGGAPVVGTERDTLAADIEQVLATDFADTVSVDSAATGSYQIIGYAGNDTLSGGKGSDYITGGAGNDTINGGAGHDTIIDFAGTNTIDGGTGFNHLDYTGAPADGALTITFNAVTTNSTASLSGAAPSTSTIKNIEWVTATPNNDSINGTSLGVDAKFEGKAGNDSLTGSTGDDTLVGDAGNDSLTSAGGNDVIYGDDVINSLSGNDTISSGAGDDTVFGGPGVDSIAGGDGNDQISGGAALDIISFRNSGGSPTDYLTETSGEIGVLNDVLYPATSNDSVAVISGQSLTNVVLSASVNALIGQASGLVARQSASGYYLATVDGYGYVHIYRVNNVGTKTELSDPQHPNPVTAASSGVLRFEVTGTPTATLRLFLNDQLLMTVTDGSALGAGAPGVYFFKDPSCVVNAYATLGNLTIQNTGSVSNSVVMVPSSSAGRAVVWNPNATLQNILTGDFDGDKRADVIGRRNDGATWAWIVGLSKGLSAPSAVQFNPAGTDTWTTSETWNNITVADFNGDGLSDIGAWSSTTGKWKISLSNGSAFKTPSSSWSASNTVTWPLTGRTFVGAVDVNGDRRADLVSYNDNGTSTTWYVAESTGTGFTETAWATKNVTGWVNPVVGDFNGDGRKDIAMRNGSGTWQLAISKGTRFSNFINTPVTWSAGAWSDVYVGDFTADGKDDIVGRQTASSSTWSLALGSGNASLASQVRTTSDANLTSVQVADLNGDGAADLFGVLSGVYRAQLSSKNGGQTFTTFASVDWLTSGTPAVAGSVQGIIVGDFNNQVRAAAQAYQNIYNNIKFEIYDGSSKNPQQTRETKSGNSIDQAALLMDDLSKAGILSTLVYGYVEVPLSNTALTDSIANWLGMRNITAAYSALTNSTMVLEVDPVGAGSWRAYNPSTDKQISSIDGFRFRHATVVAQLPGADGQMAGYILDPSWKQRDLHSATSIVHITDPSLVPFNETGTNGYLKSLKDPLADEFYRDQVAAYLKTNYPGISLADIPFDGPIVAKKFSTLPSTLSHPFTITGSSGTISGPDYHRTLVRVLGPGNTILLEQTLSVADLSDQPLLITWNATATGMVPQLRQGSVVLQQGTVEAATGAAITVHIEQLRPGQTVLGDPTNRTHDYTRSTGQPIAIGLDTGQISDQSLWRLQGQLNALANKVYLGSGSTDDYENLLMAYGEMKYLHDVHQRLDQVAALGGMVGLHPGAASGIMTGDSNAQIRFDLQLQTPVFPGSMLTDNPQLYFLLQPQDATFSYTDALNTSTALGQTYSVANATWSGLEHHIMEELSNGTAVSTVKGIQWAYANSVTVTTLTPGQSASGLSLEPAAKTSIQTALDTGYTVIVPVSEVQFDSDLSTPFDPNDPYQWVGAVWIQKKSDANSLSVGYMIQQHGATTAQGGKWLGSSLSNFIKDKTDSLFKVVGGDPVTLYSGNMTHDETDVSLPGIGLPISFSRHYDSLTSTDVGLGVGWTATFFDTLDIVVNGATTTATWSASDGLHHDFKSVSGGAFTNPKDLFGTFTVDAPNNEYVYHEKNGLEYRFFKPFAGATSYHLKYIKDSNNNQLNMNYTSGTDRLSTVTDNKAAHSGLARLKFTFDANNHLSRVEDYTDIDTGTAGAQGRQWNYAYTALTDPISGTTARYLTQATTPPTILDSNAANDDTSSLHMQYDYYNGGLLHGLMKTVTDANHPASDGTASPAITTFNYYPSRRAFSVTDAENNTEYYNYDPFHNLGRYTNAAGQTTTTRFDADGLAVKIINADGSQSTNVWDSTNSLLLSTTDEVGRTDTFDYYTNDGNKHNLFHHISKDGITTLYENYNAQSNIAGKITVSASGSTSRITNYLFDGNGNIIRAVDPLSNITRYTYNSDGTVLTVTKPKGNHPTNPNDPLGTLTAADPEDTTTFTYNDVGQVTKSVSQVDLPSSHTVTTNTDYDDYGRGFVDWTQDATGIKTTYTYDNLGNTMTTALPDPYVAAGPNGPTTSASYLDNLPVSATDANGNTSSQSYNHNRQVVRTTHPDGTFTTATYDSVGKLLSSIDELGRETQYIYDTRNRLIQILHADGALERTWFDGAGRTIASFDANGNKTAITYDAGDRVLTRTDAIGQKTTYTYTSLGDIATEAFRETGAGTDWRLTYYKTDDLGRVRQVALTALNGGIHTIHSLSTIDYDQNGNQTDQIQYDIDPATIWYENLPADPRTAPALLTKQHKTHTDYDSLDRAIGVVYADLTTSSTTYDDAGRVTTTTNQRGAVTRNGYDLAGRLYWVALPDPANVSNPPPAGSSAPVGPWPTTTYTLDKNGNQTAVQDAMGKTTSMVYDTMNRVIKQIQPQVEIFVNGSSSNGNPTSRSLYDAAGQLVSSIDANGNTVYYLYDQRGRQIQQQAPSFTDSTGALVSPTTTSTYDAAGNLITSTDAANNTTTYTYDALNRLATTTTPDPDGVGSLPARKTVNTYQHNDLTKVEIFAVGNPTAQETTDSTYDPAGRKLSETLTDPDGGGSLPRPVTNWTYDTYGNVKTMKSADLQGTSQVYTYEYDAMNRKTKEIQPQVSVDVGGGTIANVNPTTTYKYDAAGNLTDVTDPIGNYLGSTDPNFLHTTSYTYDFLNRKTSESGADPDGTGGGNPLTRPVSTWEYDKNNNITKTTTPLGNSTLYEYDALNRQTKVTTPGGWGSAGLVQDGSFETPNVGTGSYYSFQANPTGSPWTFLSNAGVAGNGSAWTYGGLNAQTGTQIAWLQVDGSMSQSISGWQAGTTYRLKLSAAQRNYGYQNQVLSIQLDGVEISQLHPAGASWADYTINLGTVSAGTHTLKIAGLNPSGGDNSALVENLSIERVLTPITTFRYDAVGNRTGEVDPLGNDVGGVPANHTTTYTYDELNHKTSMILPDPDGPVGSPVTSYAYDVNGNLKTVTDPKGNITSYTYDAWNRVTAETANVPNSGGGGTHPASQTTLYDSAGNVLQSIDRNGRVQQFTYDSLHRMTKEEWASTTAGPFTQYATWTYDNKSHLSSESDTNTTYSYAYDNLGRIVQTTTPLVTEYNTYDVAGRRTKVDIQRSAASVVTNTYTYDNLGRTTSIVQVNAGTAPDLSAKFSYDQESNLTKIQRYSTSTFTNLVATTDYSYDQAGRRTRVLHTGASTIADYNLTFDIDSRITNISGTEGVKPYTYDANDQLLTEDGKTYNYDENGNRTGGGYQVDADNRITTDGNYNYYYDDEGNLIKRTQNGQSEYTVFTYDNRNRMTSEVIYKDIDGTDPMVKQFRYTYDDLGRRVKKEIDSNADATYETVENYVYDGDTMVLVYDGANNVKQRLFQGVGADQILAEQDATGSVNWSLPDHQGTIKTILANNGASIRTISYDAFGNITGTTGFEQTVTYTLPGSSSFPTTTDSIQLYGNYTPDPAYSGTYQVHAAGAGNPGISIANWGSDDLAVIIGENESIQIINNGSDDGGPFTIVLPDDAILIRDNQGYWGEGFWGWNGITITNASSTLSYTLPYYSDNHVIMLEDGGFQTRDASQGVTAQELYDRGWVDGNGDARIKFGVIGDTPYYNADMTYATGEPGPTVTSGPTVAVDIPTNGILGHVAYSGQISGPAGANSAGMKLVNWSSAGLAILIGANESIGMEFWDIYTPPYGEWHVYLPDDAIIFRNTTGSFGVGAGYGHTVFIEDSQHTYTFADTGQINDLELAGFDVRDFSDGVSADELRALGWVDGNGVAQVKFAAVGDSSQMNATVSFPAALARQLYTGQEYDAEGGVVGGGGGLYYYGARYYDSNLGRFVTQDPKGFDAGDSNFYRYVGNDPLDNTDPDGMTKLGLALRSGVQGAVNGFANGGLSGGLAGFFGGMANSAGVQIPDLQAMKYMDLFGMNAPDAIAAVAHDRAAAPKPAPISLPVQSISMSRPQYSFCMSCHGSPDGNWVNVASGLDHRPIPLDQFMAIQGANATSRELSAKVLGTIANPRVGATFKIVGGAAETMLGVAGMVAGAPTVAGALLSVGAFWHGIDTVQAGVRQMYSKTNTPTFTSQTFAGITGSETAGEVFDAAAGVVFTLGAGAASKPPPAQIFTKTQDFNKIVSSGRVWGQTEGSVYGMGVSDASRLRTMANPMTRDPGLLVFEGEAAKLFQPHPIEGIYSGLKRMLGQYKSGFGDIVIKAATRGEGNVLTVTSAQLGAHQGQSAAWALARLWGRRALDMGLTAGTAATGYELYKAATSKDK